MPISTQSEDLKQSSSVASQYNKTFSGAVKEAAGAVDGFLKSASRSLGEGVDNIAKAAGALGKAGLSAGGSISAALNQLGGLGNYTKFNDNFIPPSKLDDIKPNEAEATKYLGGFTYPENLGEYFISFTFKTYRRKVPLGAKIDLPTITINLPIPANLSENFSMQYSDKQLGIAGYLEGTVAEAAAGGTSADFARAGEILGKDVVSKEGLYYGARSVAGLSDSLGGTVDKATGAILNPFQALIFQGVTLRSHSFSYKFSPNSARENDTLKKIIYEFKRRMHPQKDGLLFQFPDICDISFNSLNGEPYFFKTCFLESMTVNYAPQGTPAFFANTKNPVEVDISLSFKETAPLTRSDVEKYDPEKAPRPDLLGPY